MIVRVIFGETVVNMGQKFLAECRATSKHNGLTHSNKPQKP